MAPRENLNFCKSTSIFRTLLVSLKNMPMTAWRSKPHNKLRSHLPATTADYPNKHNHRNKDPKILYETVIANAI